MPKMTLIGMVQTILSDMNEDEVNSLDDTPIANQVALIVRDTYYDMVNARLWPTHTKMKPLVPSTNEDFPTHMKLPERVSRVELIKYNTKDQMSDGDGSDVYKDMIYLAPEDFLRMVHQNNPANSNIKTITDTLTADGVKYFIITDKDPEFWTSFDDEWIIFDSYDSTYDDTLQAQKSLALVQEEPAWTPSDTFIPDMPTKAFPMLLSESKKAAFITLKQVTNPIEVERARRQRTWMGGEKHRTRNKGFRYPDYGRRT